MVVFAGPTLWCVDTDSVLSADYRPPVSQGDVYAATRERPWAIGIVDGYFERVPAVWHKEILWAMARGIRVYGAASMGALRAAELAAYGMCGVGDVFAQLMSGALTDDDEVAIVHAPADMGYRPVSEAMVNIRATLKAAVAAGVVQPASHDALLGLAKGLFYPRRTFDRVIELATECGVDRIELDALADWLPTGRVDQKQIDALAMLETMATDHAQHAEEPFRVGFRFQHTDAWEQVRRQIDTRPDGGADETFQHDALLDELRLQPNDYRSLHHEALVRALAREVADRTGDRAGDSAIELAVAELRRRHGLHTPESVSSWMLEQGLGVDDLVRLLEDEARVARVRAVMSGRLEADFADLLRLAGRHQALAERALDKHRALVEHGLANPTLADANLNEDELWQWFFVVSLGGEVRDDLDAEANTLGYLDRHAMRRAVLREYCYVRIGVP